MRDQQAYQGTVKGEPSEASEWLVLGLVVALLLTALAVFVLWFSTLSSGAESGAPEQNPVPASQLSEEAVASAHEFPHFIDAIPVVTYSVGRKNGIQSPIDRQLFASQMEMLSEAGFSSVTAEELQAVVMGEDVELPMMPIILAFEGSRAEFWSDVDPILAAYGFRAQLFLSPDELRQPDEATQLSVAALKEMKASDRWEFGAQVESGRLSRNPAEPLLVWENRTRDALINARDALDDVLDIQPLSFSYPMTEDELLGGDRAVALRLPELVGAQFDLGFLSTDKSAAVDDQSDKSMLPTLPTSRTELLPEAFLGAIAEVIPQTASEQIMNPGWRGDRVGSCLFTDDTLIISADGPTKCHLVSGIQDTWTDLSLFGIHEGLSSAITTRYRFRERPAHHIDIVFSAADVQVQRRVEDESTVILQTPLRPSERAGPQPILLEVRGSRLRVTVSGREIVSVDIGPEIGAGQVSVSAESDGVDSLIVTEMTIAVPAAA